MTTEQLLVAVGCNFKGISKIDPNDSRRPGNAVVWRTSIENVVVSNIVTSRLQLIKTDQLGSFVNIYSPSGSQGERERRVLFNQDLVPLITNKPILVGDWNCVTRIEDHILAISRNRGLWDTPRIVKFGMEPPLAH